jgi:hypothetical protein
MLNNPINSWKKCIIIRRTDTAGVHRKILPETDTV